MTFVIIQKGKKKSHASWAISKEMGSKTIGMFLPLPKFSFNVTSTTKLAFSGSITENSTCLSNYFIKTYYSRNLKLASLPFTIISFEELGLYFKDRLRSSHSPDGTNLDTDTHIHTHE